MKFHKRKRTPRNRAPDLAHHHLMINKTANGVENVFLQMESKQATDAGTYVAGESVVPATIQSVFETQETKKTRRVSTVPVHSSQLDVVPVINVIQRRLCILTAAFAVSFLTAAATLALVLMMMSRNAPTASTECARQGRLQILDLHLL